MLEWIISSAVLIAIVIVLRLILKGKMSLRLQYALWAIVLLRLLIPFSFGSTAVSVQNVVERPAAERSTAREFSHISEALNDSVDYPLYMPQEVMETFYDAHVSDNVEYIEVGETQNAAQPASESKAAEARSLTVNEILNIVWAAGAGGIALWLLITNLQFYFKLRRSRKPLEVEDAPLPVYVTDRIDTPCLFGLIRPKIYVTPEVAQDAAVLRYSIEHEATHRRHGDHIWSLLRGLCLAVHWYNPLVWVAAVLSRNDAELACDEATIKRIGEEHRADYGYTLLRLTCEKRPAIFVAATTMTGSGRSIKERIKLIVKKPKTAIITLIALLLVAAVAVACTFTGAKPEDDTISPTEETLLPTETPLTQAEADSTEATPTEPTPDETEEMTRPAPRAADRTATVTLAEEGSHTCRICPEKHHYRIPRVEIRRGEDYVAYEQVQLVNEELFDTLFEYSHYYVDVDYSWWRTDDVLTILVELKTNGGEHDGVPDTSYLVYNVDVYDGHIMSVDEMLTNAAVTREEFNDLATAALLNYAYSIGAFTDPQFYPPTLQERYNYQYRVVSGEYHGTYPFWGEDGRLWIVGTVATHLPGSGFVIRAIPLSGYELDPQYAEDFASYVGQTYVSTMDPEGECHTLVIPFINLPGAGIDALNEELYRFFTTDAQAADSAPHSAAEYHWYVRGDVLTLLLQKNYGSVNPKYTIYSIRISTAHVMTKNEVLEEAGLTDAEYRALASAALGNAYCASLSDYIPRFIDTDVFLRRQFAKTIGRENTSETVLYFGENGTLCVCGRVYQITGGGSYQERLLPLTGYETSEYYEAMLSKVS